MTESPRPSRTVPKQFLGILLALCLAASAGLAAESVSLSVWAVEATQENRTEKHYDRGLAEIQKLLAALPYDTFKEVKSHRNRATAFNRESSLVLDGAHTLIVHPTGREEDGRVRIQLRVELAPKEPGKAPVTAISATLLLKPGEKIKLQGLRGQRGGELVVVLGTSA